MPQAEFEPPIAREFLLEFDTHSNDPSHHGWFLLLSFIVNAGTQILNIFKIDRLSAFEY